MFYYKPLGNFLIVLQKNICYNVSGSYFRVLTGGVIDMNNNQNGVNMEGNQVQNSAVQNNNNNTMNQVQNSAVQNNNNAMNQVQNSVVQNNNNNAMNFQTVKNDQSTQVVINVDVNHYAETFKGLLTKPFDTVSKLIEKKDTVSSVIFIILQALISSLFIAFSCMSINSQLKGWGEVPTAKNWFCMFIITIILSFILAGIVLIFAKSCNSQFTYSNCISIVASKTIIVSIIDLVAAILVLVIPGIATTLYLASAIIGLVYVIMLVSNYVQAEINKKVVLSSILAGVYVLLTILFIWVVLKTSVDMLNPLANFK